MKLSSSLLAVTAYGSLNQLQNRENDTPTIADNDRFDCMPDLGSDQQKCEARGCLWEESQTDGAPWCVFPQDYAHYKLDSVTGKLVILILIFCSKIDKNLTQKRWLHGMGIQASPNKRILPFS